VVATLFDFNGVLVDDEHVHLAAFRDVLQPLGLDVTERDYVERYLGYDDVGAFRAILEDAGRAPTDDEIRALVVAKKPAYRARVEHGLRIFAGAPEIVRRRAALGPVGIVSGALEDEIRYALERMQIADLVRFIVPAEQCERCKPDPEGYFMGLEALSALGAPHERVVAIEDSLAGIHAAKAAGLRCVAVAHSYPAEELARAGADAVAPTLAELDDVRIDGSPV
jgi:beta-phosphoglucomutase-like phosphatase (HAD superfamily)